MLGSEWPEDVGYALPLVDLWGVTLVTCIIQLLMSGCPMRGLRKVMDQIFPFDI